MTNAYLETTVGLVSPSTYEYHFEALERGNTEVKRDLNSFNFPGTEPEAAQVLKFSGKEASDRITILLYDDGSDRSNGTAPQDPVFENQDGSYSVVTVFEQRWFLDRYINTASIGATVYLKGWFWHPDDWEIHIQNLNFDIEGGKQEVQATVAFQVGNGVLI